MPPRATALQQLFAHIAATRMAGVPMVRDGFGVHALGFEALPGEDGALYGVLLTPWFMNLVVLPGDGTAPLAVGASRPRQLGTHRFDCIGAHEPGFGPWEACSLFSPVFEFDDEAAALATAQAVLDVLRRPVEPTAAPAPATAARPPAPTVPSRRALLFGRAA